MDRLRTFGFLLKDVTRLYVQRFEQRARRFGVTLPQCKALSHLSKNEGISQVRLAELAETDPMTLVRILDRMPPFVPHEQSRAVSRHDLAPRRSHPRRGL